MAYRQTDRDIDILLLLFSVTTEINILCAYVNTFCLKERERERGGGGGERKRERERERQTDRRTDGRTYIHRHKETDSFLVLRYNWGEISCTYLNAFSL